MILIMKLEKEKKSNRLKPMSKIISYGEEAQKLLTPESEIRQYEILNRKMTAYNTNTPNEPKVGEFLKIDGEYLRLTHDWGHEMQTTVRAGHPCHNDTSFYLGDGFMSFSGSLDKSLSKNKMVLIDEIRDGLCWFFFDDYSGAHRNVKCQVPLRVWEYKL